MDYLWRVLVGMAMFEALFSLFRSQRGMKIVAIVHASIVGPLALSYILENPGLRAQTWMVLTFKNTTNAGLFVSKIGRAEADLLTSISVAHFAWELVRLKYWAPSSERVTLIAHHLISILLWPLSIRLEIAYFFLIHFELSELSSPFLQLRFFARKTRYEVAVSALFAFVFFTVRSTVILPMLLAIFYSAPWDGDRYPHLSLTVRFISITSLLIPFLLNSMWTYQIVAMIKKTLTR